jgi:hypothetical protein
MTQAHRGRRRGANFTVRVTDEERVILEEERTRIGGPKGLGPWLLWRALESRPLLGSACSSGVPAPAAGPELGVSERVILDLCGGSGSWSQPYRDAGYSVTVVDPVRNSFFDVRTFPAPSSAWGVLAAPPCTEFSCARNGSPQIQRDWIKGMECVNACMRIILQCRPRWWALENPSGYLGSYLGTARDTFEPYDFGDPWTKRTQLWGDFTIPKRGPFVVPDGSACDRNTAAERAITPPGFARAFFEANP